MASQSPFTTSSTNQIADDARMWAVSERYRLKLHNLPPASARIGEALIVKLAPPKWALEWYLPRWLGETFGLPPKVADELVLANAFGLCYIGLLDKMLDEEVAQDFRHDALLVDSALHHWWLEQNALICGNDPVFWDHMSRAMAEWWTAAAASNIQPAGDFDTLLRDSWQLLAHRASPLKICCAAVTHLAHQPVLLAPLEESLDHLHVAAVLLDHAQDWMDDLDAGRYNAFVHYSSPHPQSSENCDINKRTVMDGLWFGENTQAYFAQAHARLDLALVKAEQIPCAAYHQYIVQYHQRLDNYLQVMVHTARAILEQATAQIFGEN